MKTENLQRAVEISKEVERLNNDKKSLSAIKESSVRCKNSLVYVSVCEGGVPPRVYISPEHFQILHQLMLGKIDIQISELEKELGTL